MPSHIHIKKTILANWKVCAKNFLKIMNNNQIKNFVPKVLLKVLLYLIKNKVWFFKTFKNKAKKKVVAQLISIKK